MENTANSEPVTVEVLGFDTAHVINQALKEIAECKTLGHLSGRSLQIVASALQHFGNALIGSGQTIIDIE